MAKFLVIQWNKPEELLEIMSSNVVTEVESNIYYKDRKGNQWEGDKVAEYQTRKEAQKRFDEQFASNSLAGNPEKRKKKPTQQQCVKENVPTPNTVTSVEQQHFTNNSKNSWGSMKKAKVDVGKANKQKKKKTVNAIDFIIDEAEEVQVVKKKARTNKKVITSDTESDEELTKTLAAGHELMKGLIKERCGGTSNSSSISTGSSPPSVPGGGTLRLRPLGKNLITNFESAVDDDARSVAASVASTDDVTSPLSQLLCLNVENTQKETTPKGVVDGLKVRNVVDSPSDVLSRGELFHILGSYIKRTEYDELVKEIKKLKSKIKDGQSAMDEDSIYDEMCRLIGGYSNTEIFNATHLLMTKYFTTDYISKHSITGRKKNSRQEIVKEGFDEVLLGRVRRALIEKFNVSTSEVNSRIKSVLRKYTREEKKKNSAPEAAPETPQADE